MAFRGEREAGCSGINPVGLDARLPRCRGAGWEKAGNAQAAPAGLAGGAQARGIARGGAGGGEGSWLHGLYIPSAPVPPGGATPLRPGPDRHPSTFPAPPRQAGFLTPSSLPSLPPSQALTGLGPLPPPPPPLKTPQDQRETPDPGLPQGLPLDTDNHRHFQQKDGCFKTMVKAGPTVHWSGRLCGVLGTSSSCSSSTGDPSCHVNAPLAGSPDPWLTWSTLLA